MYVSDAGKVETAYWRNTLSKFFVDGRRIKITRVVDYYHATERLTTIADALKFGKDKSKRNDTFVAIVDSWVTSEMSGKCVMCD